MAIGVDATFPGVFCGLPFSSPWTLTFAPPGVIAAIETAISAASTACASTTCSIPP